ncbi:hypothetical protein [Halogranum rubrum]|uniref:Uncharacterized protein n=1 Tax=Halogranum salarium B-1 TaxID=1210908 RepID=J2ZB59_9EURY|nr:hypothetical protein [Halogranum salarium]EJN57890.1 hypothetical protein HSB1_33070 [Halogranum salarium B-1]
MNRTITRFGWVWRGVVVGGGFVLVQILSPAIVGLLGLYPVAIGVDDATAVLGGVVVAGVVVGTVCGPVARSLSGGRPWQFFVWSTLLFANAVGFLLEGTFFAPALAPIANLPGGLLSQLLTALVTAGLITWLYVPPETTTTVDLRDRPWPSWLGRVLAATAVYVVLFLVVGSVNYQLVTRPYYETSFVGLATPPMEQVVVLELVRGLLIVCSVVPLVRAVRGSRRRGALLAGGLLFVFAGVVPLLFQAFTLPPFLVFASSYEILLQVGPTGVAVAYLLAPRDRPARRPPKETVA